MSILRKKMRSEHAQGLVEMAIITPILIVMLIGMFEVGYAIWGYLTLLNVDREATRFAVRAGALDFNEITTDDIGYSNVITHALISNASQLKLQDHLFNAGGVDDPQAAIVVSHIVIDTKQPCANPPNCCNGWTPADDYTRDDFVVDPETPGFSQLRYVYPPTSTVASRLTGAALISKTAELKQANDIFNCQLAQKTNSIPSWSNNSVIIVEMFYEQPQLLGFPVMSWILNPFPIYVQTTMRIDSNDRELCTLIPIAVNETNLPGWEIGSPLKIDIMNDGGLPGQAGWLSWNPANTDSVYLASEINEPRLATNDFTEAIDPADTQLNIGDWVAALPGINDKAQVRDALDSIVGRTVTVPVFNNTSAGSPVRYRVSKFIQVRITSYDLPHEIITAEFVDHAPDACPSNGF